MIADRDVPVGGVTVCLAKCWSCRLGQCVGGPHPMWDESDVEDPTSGDSPPDRQCGCPCTTEPSYDPGPDGPDFDEPVLSLDAVPCALCGESGPCGYDNEGRPMIHSIPAGTEADID